MEKISIKLSRQQPSEGKPRVARQPVTSRWVRLRRVPCCKTEEGTKDPTGSLNVDFTPDGGLEIKLEGAHKCGVKYELTIQIYEPLPSGDLDPNPWERTDSDDFSKPAGSGVTISFTLDAKYGPRQIVKLPVTSLLGCKIVVTCKLTSKCGTTKTLTESFRVR